MLVLRIPIQVLVYLAHHDGTEWEYLLLRRIPKLGGFWQGITGAPEGFDTLVQAAKREVFEETGFSPPDIRSINFSYTFPVDPKWRNSYQSEVDEIAEHVFVAEVKRVAPQLSFEHDAWKWCSFHEAVDLLKYPENVEALLRCQFALQSGAGNK